MHLPCSFCLLWLRRVQPGVVCRHMLCRAPLTLQVLRGLWLSGSEVAQSLQKCPRLFLDDYAGDEMQGKLRFFTQVGASTSFLGVTVATQACRPVRTGNLWQALQQRGAWLWGGREPGERPRAHALVLTARIPRVAGRRCCAGRCAKCLLTSRTGCCGRCPAWSARWGSWPGVGAMSCCTCAQHRVRAQTGTASEAGGEAPARMLFLSSLLILRLPSPHAMARLAAWPLPSLALCASEVSPCASPRAPGPLLPQVAFMQHKGDRSYLNSMAWLTLSDADFCLFYHYDLEEFEGWEHPEAEARAQSGSD